MESIKQFRELELGRLSSGTARIKIKTDTAETKWINLTAKELEQIKVILCRP